MFAAQKLLAPIPERPWRPECAICKTSVKIEDSKTDEYGRAVHEECYVNVHGEKKPPEPLRLAHRAATGLASWSKPLACVLMFRSSRDRRKKPSSP